MQSELSIAKAYEILELPYGASLKAAEAGYRKLAIQVHLDHFQNNPKMRLHAEEEQRKLNEAIRTLRIRFKEDGHTPSESYSDSKEPEPPRSSAPEPPKPQTPPRSESKAPPHPDPPEPQSTTPPPAPEHAASPRAKKAPTWRTQMWGLFSAVFIVAKIVTTAHGWYETNAKDRSESTGTVAAPVPASGDSKSHPSEEAAIRGTVPDVQVYIAPGSAALKAAGVTDDSIRKFVQQGLANRRIVSIPKNAVVDGLGDSAYVRFSDEPVEDGSRIHIELSVRNGASANNQLVRWEETATIEALGDPTDLPRILNKLMDDLQAAFNSPAYKAGRRDEVSQ